jgi:hypothetical protein
LSSWPIATIQLLAQDCFDPPQFSKSSGMHHGQKGA